MNTDLWVIVKESNIKKLINIDKIKGDCGRNKFKKENGQVLAKLIKDIKPFFHKCLQTPCSIIIKINHTQIHHSKCFGNQKERINERGKKTFLLKVYRTHTHTHPCQMASQPKCQKPESNGIIAAMCYQ